MPCAHFSILPSTPQAASPRKIGMVKGLSPAAGVIIAEHLAETGAGRHVRQDRRDDRAEQADRGLLAVEQLADRVCPSAPLTWPSGCVLAAVPGDKIALSTR